MLFTPSTCASLWDVSLYNHEGTHFMFYLASTRLDRPWDAIGLATSDDGVHFEDHGPVIEKAKNAEWMGGGMVWKVDNRYLMNFSECRGGRQSIYFAESADLVNWDRVPAELSSCHLDKRWYSEGTEFSDHRWDGIWVTGRDGQPGYFGYLTAVSSEGPEGLRGTAASVVSDDGLRFTPGAPVVPAGIWGDKLEVGAVTKIDDYYYMLAAQAEVPLGLRWTRHHPQAAGGVYVLRADHQDGPFTSVPGQKPLLVSAPDHYTYFARFYDNAGETLVCHHSVAPARDIANTQPKAGTAFAPLKRVTVSDGVLGLGWWEGNDALVGSELPLSLELANGRGLSAVPEVTGRNLVVQAAAGGVAALPHLYDLDRGVILECRVAVREARTASFGIGLFVEGERAWAGSIFLVDETGTLSVGRYNGYGFRADDTKAAAVQDIREPSSWRLLLRRRFAELYVDNRLVQCYTLGTNPSGRLGLVVESARASFSEMTLNQMQL